MMIMKYEMDANMAVDMQTSELEATILKIWMFWSLLLY
jgi:hypothetical protein